MAQEYWVTRRKSRKGGYLYHVTYYQDGEKHTVSLGKRTKAEAIVEAKKRWQELRHPSMTLADFATGFYDEGSAWIKRQRGKKRSISQEVARSRAGHLENYILPQWGKKALRDIDAVSIEDWLMSLDLSNQSRNHIWYSLRVILKEAARARLIEGVPPVEPMGTDSKETDVLTPTEYMALFPRELDELRRIWGGLFYGAAFMTLASTGIRPGELRALQWRHYFGSVLWIEQAFKDMSGLGLPKGGYARPVAVPGRTEGVLNAWREESLFTEDDALIFYGVGPDKPLYRKKLNTAMAEALTRAKIEPKGRELTPRGFRHFYNTMVRRKMPADALRLMVGHRDSRLTDRYDHPDQEALLDQARQQRALVDKLF